MKELREERIKKDEEKLLNAIHEQYKKAHLDYVLDERMEQFSKKENQFSKFASLKKINFIKNIALILAIISILILGAKYNEKEISKCMESGNSETFCRFAGE